MGAKRKDTGCALASGAIALKTGQLVDTVKKQKTADICGYFIVIGNTDLYNAKTFYLTLYTDYYKNAQ